MGNVLPSKFGRGYYYPYKDENGKERGLPMPEWVYNEYYEPGYLTDDMLDAMLADKTVEFTATVKGGLSQTIKAHLQPYVNKRGQNTKIIVFDSEDQITDNKIIEANAEKIVLSYYEAGSRYGFNYQKPQTVVSGLGLSHVWKTWSNRTIYYVSDIENNVITQCYTIDVYQARNSKNKFTFYGKVVNGVASMIDEAQYKAEEKAADDYLVAKKKIEADKAAARKKLEEETSAARAEYVAWESELTHRLSGLNTAAFIASVEPEVAGIPVDEADIVKIINSSYLQYFDRFVFRSHSYSGDPIYWSYITTEHHAEEDIKKCKAEVLKRLAAYTAWLKLKHIRADLWNKVKTEGLDKATDGVDIDTALDIGNFKEVKKVLLKHKADSPRYICLFMYPEILDGKALEEKLLNMLKIYHDFYDFPEKDRKAIAKFIAKNNLKDYYEKISQYDDVLEELIDNSRDPKLTKPLLESIAGTSKANVLKDKTYYFEKTGHIKESIIVNKPKELLERFLKLIPVYNADSGVAVITNIVLEADWKSFTFQFYTFADGEGDESGFDGRRFGNFTRIYNRLHPDEKIGFYFDNDSSSSDEEAE